MIRPASRGRQQVAERPECLESLTAAQAFVKRPVRDANALHHRTAIGAAALEGPFGVMETTVFARRRDVALVDEAVPHRAFGGGSTILFAASDLAAPAAPPLRGAGAAPVPLYLPRGGPPGCPCRRRRCGLPRPRTSLRRHLRRRRRPPRRGLQIPERQNRC